jgi:hypothetical protein
MLLRQITTLHTIAEAAGPRPVPRSIDRYLRYVTLRAVGSRTEAVEEIHRGAYLSMNKGTISQFSSEARYAATLPAGRTIGSTGQSGKSETVSSPASEPFQHIAMPPVPGKLDVMVPH